MGRRAPAASLILSTYNSPDLLERSLLGYARQECRDFEIVIADDGSNPETRHLIERHRAQLGTPIVHVWQRDQGFRKARAANLAALFSRAPYLIFSDGDCIPHRLFVSEHLAAGQDGGYVVGGFVRLTREQTQGLTRDDVVSGRFEELAGPRQRMSLRWIHAKSVAHIALQKLRKPKLYGLNFSVDRASFFRLNGFDMTFENCSREDCDLRNRMQLAGLRARSLWHRVGVYHQDHPPHVGRLGWTEGYAYYRRNDRNEVTSNGLRELQAELDLGRSPAAASGRRAGAPPRARDPKDEARMR